MNNINKIEYYFEAETPYDESKLKHGLGIKKRLYSKKEYFKTNDGTSGEMLVEIIDTYAYGKTLVIDGIVQTSEADEFIYHESMAHIPMLYHDDPQNVLIIGGGDGGVLREVLKHNISTVTMVEISKEVIEASKKFLPSISNGAFEDNRVNLIIGDGKEFIEKSENNFDVIILDLSDPEGPAEGLISEDFYKNVAQALKNDGIISVQNESLTYQPELVKKIQNNLKKAFKNVFLHTANIPTYQGSVFGIGIATNKELNIEKNKIANKLRQLGNLKYLDKDVFYASRIIPKYLKNKIGIK